MRTCQERHDFYAKPNVSDLVFPLSFFVVLASVMVIRGVLSTQPHNRLTSSEFLLLQNYVVEVFVEGMYIYFYEKYGVNVLHPK